MNSKDTIGNDLLTNYIKTETPDLNEDVIIQKEDDPLKQDITADNNVEHIDLVNIVKMFEHNIESIIENNEKEDEEYIVDHIVENNVVNKVDKTAVNTDHNVQENVESILEINDENVLKSERSVITALPHWDNERTAVYDIKNVDSIQEDKKYKNIDTQNSEGSKSEDQINIKFSGGFPQEDRIVAAKNKVNAKERDNKDFNEIAPKQMEKDSITVQSEQKKGTKSKEAAKHKISCKAAVHNIIDTGTSRRIAQYKDDLIQIVDLDSYEQKNEEGVIVISDEEDIIHNEGKCTPLIEKNNKFNAKSMLSVDNVNNKRRKRKLLDDLKYKKSLEKKKLKTSNNDVIMLQKNKGIDQAQAPRRKLLDDLNSKKKTYIATDDFFKETYPTTRDFLTEKHGIIENIGNIRKLLDDLKSHGCNNNKLDENEENFLEDEDQDVTVEVEIKNNLLDDNDNINDMLEQEQNILQYDNVGEINKDSIEIGAICTVDGKSEHTRLDCHNNEVSQSQEINREVIGENNNIDRIDTKHECFGYLSKIENIGFKRKLLDHVESNNCKNNDKFDDNEDNLVKEHDATMEVEEIKNELLDDNDNINDVLSQEPNILLYEQIDETNEVSIEIGEICTEDGKSEHTRFDCHSNEMSQGQEFSENNNNIEVTHTKHECFGHLSKNNVNRIISENELTSNSNRSSKDRKHTERDYKYKQRRERVDYRKRHKDKSSEEKRRNDDKGKQSKSRTHLVEKSSHYDLHRDKNKSSKEKKNTDNNYKHSDRRRESIDKKTSENEAAVKAKGTIERENRRSESNGKHNKHIKEAVDNKGNGKRSSRDSGNDIRDDKHASQKRPSVDAKNLLNDKDKSVGKDKISDKSSKKIKDHNHTKRTDSDVLHNKTKSIIENKKENIYEPNTVIVNDDSKTVNATNQNCSQINIKDITKEDSKRRTIERNVPHKKKLSFEECLDAVTAAMTHEEIDRRNTKGDKKIAVTALDNKEIVEKKKRKSSDTVIGNSEPETLNATNQNSSQINIKDMTKEDSKRSTNERNLPHEKNLSFEEIINGVTARTIEETDQRSTKGDNTVAVITPHNKETVVEMKGKQRAKTIVNEFSKHIENIKTIMRWSNATPIRRFQKNRYECAFCEMTFYRPYDLKTHTLKYHRACSEAYFTKKPNLDSYFVQLDITDLQCFICCEKIHDVEALTGHLVDVHAKTMHTDIKNHLVPFKFHKNNPYTLTCYICSCVRTRFRALSDHVISTHCRNYICEICDIGYVNYRKLQYHMRVHAQCKFQCPNCDEVFDTAVKKTDHDEQIGC